MKTDKITVFDLFEKQRRYLVPIFQRGYVWTKEHQWEPLWEDITDQARLLQQHHGSENSIRKHFLGTIVLSHLPTVIRQTTASEIIDGQQRLLTLQVFLASFRDAITPLQNDYLNTQLSHLTRNVGPFIDESEEYKVWPTNAYQQDVKNILMAGSPEKLRSLYQEKKGQRKLIHTLPRLVEAYIYYHQVISEFLNGLEDEHIPPARKNTLQLIKERGDILFEAVMRYIQLVEIQLDAEDDPQVIFETLNYRGVPLEPSDLIRNFIFLYASRNNNDVSSLYDKYWKDYDEAAGETGKFWKEKERQGRFFRSRLDLFFFHYLTYRIGREIKIGHLYQEFKDWWGDSSERLVESELEAAQKSSIVFKSFIEDKGTNRLGVLSQILRILDTTTIYPFMLWLCENEQKMSPDEFDGILADIESYVVRRAVCRLTPKNYNHIFLSLLMKLKGSMPTRKAIQYELLSLSGDSAVWPNDQIFRRRLIYDPLYDSIGPKRVRLILTVLELASRTPCQEALPLPIENKLTIEHIKPRGFKPEEWPYPDRDIVELQKLESSQKDIESKRKELELRRWTLLHSLGNLTLLTQPLNSIVSNGPFSTKRPEISGQSLLKLNSYFQKFSNDSKWDEDIILERGKELAMLALKIWEYPSI